MQARIASKMKILKRLFIGLSFVTLFCIISGYIGFRYFFVPGPNQLIVGTGNSRGSDKIPMVWVASPGTPEDPYGALLVPITFQGIDQTFYMQLDLGHPDTVFYPGKLLSILERTSTTAGQVKLSDLEKVSFKVGDIPVVAKKVKLRGSKDNRIDWDNIASIELIGTLGSDFVEGSVMVMNYPLGMIQRLDDANDLKVPEEQWRSFYFRYRRTLLPAKIDSTNTLVMYDTGASAFDLITSDENFEKLAIPNSETTTTTGNSWGKQISIFHRPSLATMEFGTTALPIRRVTKMDGMGTLASALMGMSGMRGMTGNTIFLKHVLVLDYGKQRMYLNGEFVEKPPLLHKD